MYNLEENSPFNELVNEPQFSWEKIQEFAALLDLQFVEGKIKEDLYDYLFAYIGKHTKYHPQQNPNLLVEEDEPK